MGLHFIQLVIIIIASEHQIVTDCMKNIEIQTKEILNVDNFRIYAVGNQCCRRQNHIDKQRKKMIQCILK